MSTTKKLTKQKLITPPPWLPNNVQYETTMGSIAYGVSTDNSDIDIYGFCIPPKDIIFPHLRGEIPGFGRQTKRFDQYQQHHVKNAGGEKEYDLSIYNIVRYFHLCMDNNPNMLDSLFTPINCVRHCTAVGQMVRDSRRLFLHKGAWHKFKGYAYSQFHKMKSQKREGKRKLLFDKYGYDVKFGYHTVRLVLEAEMILSEGDIELGRHAEHLKAIRRGESSLAEVEQFFKEKEKHLEKLYEASKLPWGPDEEKIKALLLSCLEHHYGSLEKAVSTDNQLATALRQIQEITNSIKIS